MVTDHEHVEMLIHRVHRERHRGVRGGGQDIGLPADLDDVRSVPAAGAFRMERVNRPSLEGLDRVFDEPRFVQRVGMNGDLNIELFRDIEAGRNRRRRGAPVFVQLQPDRPRFDLLTESVRER